MSKSASASDERGQEPRRPVCGVETNDGSPCQNPVPHPDMTCHQHTGGTNGDSTSEPYRYECPEGHRAVKRVSSETGYYAEPDRWYCKTCGAHYERVLDLKADREVSA